MSKTVTILIIIIVVALLLGVVLYATQKGSSTNSSNSNSNTTANRAANAGNANSSALSNTNASTNSAATTGNAVTITRSGFSPKTLTVQAGQRITWTNSDSSVHYVAPNDHPTHVKYSGIWNDDGTGQISPGQTYTITISTPGTYGYHDHLNPSTTGTIVVQ